MNTRFIDWTVMINKKYPLTLVMGSSLISLAKCSVAPPWHRLLHELTFCSFFVNKTMLLKGNLILFCYLSNLFYVSSLKHNCFWICRHSVYCRAILKRCALHHCHHLKAWVGLWLKSFLISCHPQIKEESQGRSNESRATSGGAGAALPHLTFGEL